MHTKFQEIINKFLKSNTQSKGVNGDPSASNTINIQQTLFSYENHINLYHLLINYLDSESSLLSKNLESGQITDAQQITKISDKIKILSESTDQLLSLIDRLNSEFSTLVTNRDFLNLQTPKFSDFEHFSNSAEFNIFFLNDDYTSDFPNSPKFKRLNLNKNDFLKLELAYQSSSNPADFLYKIQQSLNLENDKKIALCNYEPRHNGFLVYFDPKDTDTTAIFENISKRMPTCLYKINDGDSWIINTLEYNFDTCELLTCFNAWIDTNWLTIYLQDTLFPINKLSNSLINNPIRQTCHHGSFISTLKDAVALDKSTLISAISQANPYWYLEKVEIHDGNDFVELIEKPITIHFDLLLIRFFNGENTAFIAYYNPQDNQLILSTEANNTEAEIIIKTYLLGFAIYQENHSWSKV